MKKKEASDSITNSLTRQLISLCLETLPTWEELMLYGKGQLYNTPFIMLLESIFFSTAFRALSLALADLYLSPLLCIVERFFAVISFWVLSLKLLSVNLC